MAADFGTTTHVVAALKGLKGQEDLNGRIKEVSIGNINQVIEKKRIIKIDEDRWPFVTDDPYGEVVAFYDPDVFGGDIIDKQFDSLHSRRKAACILAYCPAKSEKGLKCLMNQQQIDQQTRILDILIKCVASIHHNTLAGSRRMSAVLGATT